MIDWIGFAGFLVLSGYPLQPGKMLEGISLAESLGEVYCLLLPV